MESKQQIIDEFNFKNSDTSKKSLERDFKEFIVKEKRDKDLRPVWYATEIIMDKLKLSTEEKEEL